MAHGSDFKKLIRGKDTLLAWANIHLKLYTLIYPEDLMKNDCTVLDELLRELFSTCYPQNKTRKTRSKQCRHFLKSKIPYFKEQEDIEARLWEKPNAEDLLNLLLRICLHHLAWVFSHNHSVSDGSRLLLDWINSYLPRSVGAVPNFDHQHWRDGIRLAALINAIDSGMCSEWQQWDNENHNTNIQLAITDAQTKLTGVNPLLDPSDICSKSIPQFCLVVFLSQLPTARIKGKERVIDKHPCKKIELLAQSDDEHAAAMPVRHSPEGRNSSRDGLNEEVDTSGAIISTNHTIRQDNQSRVEAETIPKTIIPSESTRCLPNTYTQPSPDANLAERTGQLATPRQPSVSNMSNMADRSLPSHPRQRTSSEANLDIRGPSSQTSAASNQPTSPHMRLLGPAAPRTPLIAEEAYISSLSSHETSTWRRRDQDTDTGVESTTESDTVMSSTSFEDTSTMLSTQRRRDRRRRDQVTARSSAAFKEYRLAEPYNAKQLKKYITEDSIHDKNYLQGYHHTRCHGKKGPKIVLVKMTKVAKDGDNSDAFMILEEAYIRSLFKHKNILKLYGVVLVSDFIYITMPKMKCSLKDWCISTCDKKQKHQLQMIFADDIAQGMAHISCQCGYIIHNISTESIYISDDDAHPTAKITDLSMVKSALHKDLDGNDGVQWMGGNQHTVPPEVEKHQMYTTKSDVFMYAVTVAEMFNNGKKLKDSNIFTALSMGHSREIPAELVDVPRWLYSLLILCWSQEQKNRPPFKRVCNEFCDNFPRNDRRGVRRTPTYVELDSLSN